MNAPTPSLWKAIHTLFLLRYGTNTLRMYQRMFLYKFSNVCVPYPNKNNPNIPKSSCTHALSTWWGMYEGMVEFREMWMQADGETWGKGTIMFLNGMKQFSQIWVHPKLKMYFRVRVTCTLSIMRLLLCWINCFNTTH